MPGRDPGGCIITMLIGVVERALLGGFLSSRLLSIDRGGFFDLRTWIIAIVGSIVLLLIYRLIAAAKNAAVTLRPPRAPLRRGFPSSTAVVGGVRAAA